MKQEFKEVRKYKWWIIKLIIATLLASCDPPLTSISVPLELSPEGSCFKCGSTDHVQFTASITVVYFDGNQRVTAFDESVSGGSNNKNFDIWVPETGTYVVDVVALGTECSTCCVNCNYGYPRWRGAEDFLNSTSDQEGIYMDLQLLGCLCECDC